MKRTALLVAVVAMVLASALLPGVAAAAQEPGGPHGRSVDWSVVAWTVAGIGLTALILGVFYFFKREVGGFPKNPSWVAPIQIMPSREFPDEGDFGEQDASHHAPAGH